MLSTKSFFVRFLREHELKIDVVNYTNFTNTVTMTFHFANRMVKGQGTRDKGQGLIALSTSEPQNLRTSEP